jgi:hypothetical protein
VWWSPHFSKSRPESVTAVTAGYRSNHPDCLAEETHGYNTFWLWLVRWSDDCWLTSKSARTGLWPHGTGSWRLLAKTTFPYMIGQCQRMHSNPGCHVGNAKNKIKQKFNKN